MNADEVCQILFEMPQNMEVISWTLCGRVHGNMIHKFFASRPKLHVVPSLSEIHVRIYRQSQEIIRKNLDYSHCQPRVDYW